MDGRGAVLCFPFYQYRQFRPLQVLIQGESPTHTPWVCMQLDSSNEGEMPKQQRQCGGVQPDASEFLYALQQHITWRILLQGIPPEHMPWVCMHLSSSDAGEMSKQQCRCESVPRDATDFPCRPPMISTWCIWLQGIPPEYRPWVWMELSGGNKRRSEHMASYYEAMVDMGEASSECTHQIELVPPPPPPSSPPSVSELSWPVELASHPVALPSARA